MNRGLAGIFFTQQHQETFFRGAGFWRDAGQNYKLDNLQIVLITDGLQGALLCIVQFLE